MHDCKFVKAKQLTGKLCQNFRWTNCSLKFPLFSWNIVSYDMFTCGIKVHVTFNNEIVYTISFSLLLRITASMVHVKGMPLTLKAYRWDSNLYPQRHRHKDVEQKWTIVHSRAFTSQSETIVTSRPIPSELGIEPLIWGIDRDVAFELEQ